ncbi:NTP transferase domain-containing protein [Amaricoccus sp.]|uniref:NTP transferase domain-containing protein n=1 Tax=Amaricoccus sp. TaxID=1872485 RepID=UPI0039E273CC
MRFGPVPLSDAVGAVLAHGLAAGGIRLKKGRVLGPADLAALAAAGVETVTVARLDPGDVGEDAAAEAIAAALLREGAGLSVSAPFTGRVNLFATTAGVLRVDRTAVDGLNALDPAITLASLPAFARVAPRQMVATVKVIPYAVAGETVRLAVRRLLQSAGVLRLHPFRPQRVSLILTQTPGMKPSLLDKGAQVVADRLAALGQRLDPPVTVAHETAAVAAAIAAAAGEIVLVLGASATSDVGDVCPAGLVAAGGELVRFGMPVDPGNLLILGRQGGRPVLGLPGCARSPALNGADWVLERLAAGLDVTGADLAGMGVGGLLKEIPARPQPRAGRAVPAGRPRVAALVLAAGAGRRMRGADKLLEPVAGEPVLARVARAARQSQADETVVVLPPGATGRRDAVAGLGVEVVEAPDCAEGMAASLRAGLAAVQARADAVVVLLADMPEVGPRAIDRLIAAFDPEEGRELCRAVSADGTPGHPVLFGRRFFETLAALTGDRGAREVIRDAAEFVTEVATEGQGAVVDLDTPEDWAAWRAAQRR